MKERFVMPGEQLSTSEELLPGDGTYEEDGIIRAARVGKYIIDNKFRRAKVIPATSVPVVLRKGDTVIAQVTSTRASMIVADVIHVVGKNRGVSGDTNATIHVKEIASGYVKDATTEYFVGDYIRAKVIQTKPSLQLATKDRNLGVIKALCTKCRHLLTKKGPMLECDNCGNKEKRRYAQDYGDIDLTRL